MRWATKKLVDLCSIKTGKLNSNQAVANGEYPFFTCAPETLKINQYSFDTEAVLLAGNNAAGVYPLKYYDGKFDAYQRTYVFETLDEDNLNVRYLYYALIPVLGYFQSVSIGASTQYLTKSVLDNFQLPLPSIRLQQKIVSTLAAYDDLIENNLKRMALLEESARLLYREWFVRLRFPGYEHTRIVDGVPEGWEKKELRDLCDEIRQQINPDKIDAETPYIGLEHMPRKSITLSEWGNAANVQSAKHKFAEGDILFGKIRPYFHKVGVCFTSGIASTDAIVLRPLNTDFYGLVLMTVSSDLFVSTATQSSYGAKMPRANWKVLERFVVACPPEGLSKIFTGFVQTIVSQLRLLVLQNQKLKQARDLLLPRLMNGEIEV